MKILKLASEGVVERKINEIIDQLNSLSLENGQREDALLKFAERYRSLPESFVFHLVKNALKQEEVKDEILPKTDVI